MLRTKHCQVNASDNEQMGMGNEFLISMAILELILNMNASSLAFQTYASELTNEPATKMQN